MKKKLNILHWPGSYPDPERGEAYHAIFVQEHISSLLPYTNNRVLFVSPGQPQGPGLHEQKESVENGIPVTRFYFSNKTSLLLQNLYIRLILLLHLIRLIFFKKFRPDVIHVHFYQSYFWARLYARLFGIPVVITEHWSAFLGWPDLGQAKYAAAAQAFREARHVFPVSEAILSGIEQRTGTSIRHKSSVIPNAVDTDVFHIDPARQPEQEPALKKLLFVGRNAEEKDLPNLLQAFSLVSARIKAELHLAGSGDYYDLDELKRKFAIADEALVIHGTLSKQQISRLMQEAHLLVISSFMENAPCIIGEAHCCGLPVAATAVGGISELLIAGTTAPARSPALLAEAVIETLNRSYDKKNIALEAAATFGHTATGSKLHQAYEKLTRTLS